MATPLHIRELRVNRAPGFREAGFTLRDLSPGINVVFGPNNVGKSTTARLLQLVLWPDATFEGIAGEYSKGVIAQAQMDHEGSQWLIDLAAGRRHCERDGEDAAPPVLPGAEVRSRYHLALHDLLQANNRDFAQAILQESAGGIDLAAAGEELNFTGKPSRPRKLYSDLNDAERAVTAATQSQHQLQQKAGDLKQLQARVASARQAHTQVQAVERVLAQFDAEAQLAAATEAIEQFPKAMAQLTGQEREQLEEWRKQQREAMDTIEAARKKADQAAGQLDEISLPAEGLPGTLLNELDGLVNELADAEQQGRQLRTQSKAAQDALPQHRPAIGASDEQLAAIDVTALNDLGQWARARTTAVANHTAAQAALDQHDKRQPGDAEAQADRSQRSEQLREALSILSSYLKHARPEAVSTDAVGQAEEEQQASDQGGTDEAKPISFMWPAVVAAVLLLIAGIALGLAHWVGWLIVVIALAISGWLAWLLMQQQQAERTAAAVAEAEARAKAQAEAAHAEQVGEDPGVVAERDYTRLAGVPQPEAWRREAVQACLDQVARELVRAEQAVVWQDRRAALAEALDQADAALAETETTRDALAQRLGFALPEGVERQDAALLHLAQRIADWQIAFAESQQLANQLEQMGSEHAGLIEQFNKAIGPYADAKAKGANDARALVQQLRDRANAAERATQDARVAKEQASTAKQQHDRAEAQIHKLFQRLDLMGEGDPSNWPADPEAGLHRLLNQREAYQQALEQQRTARAQLTAATQACEAMGEACGALQAASRDELLERREAKVEEAEKFDQYMGELKALETELANARKGRDLEEALSQRDAARAALEKQHSEDLAAVVGQALVDHLREQARRHDQPAVFRRAAKLFAMITHGCWSLEFEAGQDSPAFTAIDTRTGRAHKLDELSSGTRVQLLLAVRLAFVELQERGLMLPLILDETLGNSDDDRARAIIEAVVELAKAGRQVFYFTAQEDEAHKWRTLVNEQQGVGFHEVDLLAARREMQDHESLTPVQAIGVAARSFEGPPEPEQGESHAAYGQRLGVQPINPRRPVGDIHLWHLTDSPAELYEALQAGVSQWGPAENLAVTGSRRVWTDPATWSRVRARAKACEEALACWAIGRGEPLDRQALEECEAVTNAFIDRVAELCDELHGDAGKLIAAIEDGEAKGFRSNKLDELRTWCEEHSYLDTAQPLTTQEAYVRVLAACSDDNDQGLGPQEVRAVLAAVGFNEALD